MDSRSSSNATNKRPGGAALIWQGTTPSGYSVVIERDERHGWIATVGGASRSRNTSLEAALLEAGGTVVSRSWAARVAAAAIARSASVTRTTPQ